MSTSRPDTTPIGIVDPDGVTRAQFRTSACTACIQNALSCPDKGSKTSSNDARNKETFKEGTL